MKEVFSDIIKNWRWKKHPCGPGSTLEYTENLRNALPELIKKHKILSILDAPCGDFSWMSTITFNSDINYIGADIVDFMIEENKKKYPEKDFRILDITKDSFPDVDLLICRDCLLHLSNADIIKTFKNISSSNIKYILLSNWYEDFNNLKDIPTGKHRYINFLEEPYFFEPPLDEIIDYIDGFPKRKMVLWKKDTIDNFIRNV